MVAQKLYQLVSTCLVGCCVLFILLLCPFLAGPHLKRPNHYFPCRKDTQFDWAVFFCLFLSNGKESGNGIENFLLGCRHARPADHRPLACARASGNNLDGGAFVSVRTGADGALLSCWSALCRALILNCACGSRLQDSIR